MKRTTYTVHVGAGQDKDGMDIRNYERTDMLAHAKLRTARLFGGYSVSECFGGWVDPHGRIVEERAYRIEVSTDASFGLVWSWANEVRDIFRQTSVLLTSFATQTNAFVESERQPETKAA